MVRKARPRLPRLLLIYCEGKTEKAYFDALLDVHRPHSLAENNHRVAKNVSIFGKLCESDRNPSTIRRKSYDSRIKMNEIRRLFTEVLGQ